MIWLIPLVSQQLQSLIVEIPKWLNAFMFFVQDIPTKYPDLVSSDQIATFLQTASSQITSISQDFLKASISGIQNTLLVAINLILLPILVFFFLFDRKSIIAGFLSVLPKERTMLKQVWVEMDEQLSNYSRGKVIEIIIVGSVAALLFMYFDLQYVALLSVLVGLSVLIPFLGAFIVTLPVAAVGLLQFNLTFDLNDKKFFIFIFFLFWNYFNFNNFYTFIYFATKNCFIWRKINGILVFILFTFFFIN